MNVENFNKQSTVGMTALTETEVFRVPIKEMLWLSINTNIDMGVCRISAEDHDVSLRH